jgi:hypothetical protein
VTVAYHSKLQGSFVLGGISALDSRQWHFKGNVSIHLKGHVRWYLAHQTNWQQATYVKGHRGASELSFTPIETLEAEVALVHRDVVVLLYIGLDLMHINSISIDGCTRGTRCCQQQRAMAYPFDIFRIEVLKDGKATGDK